MKQVEAIVSGSKLDDVRISLGRAGVGGMTVTDVRGYERENERTERYRGAQHQVYLVTKVKVEVVVEDGRVPAVVEELVRVTRTGRLGDGRIFVSSVEDAVRVRTGERGRDIL